MLEICCTIIGASLSEPHTSDVHRPTNQPTNRVHPIYMILICCTCPRYHVAPPCHTYVNSVVRSHDSYITKNADDGKVKSRNTRATNCEAGTRERPVNLFILALSCQCHHASLGFTYVSFSHRSLHTSPFSHFPT